MRSWQWEPRWGAAVRDASSRGMRFNTQNHARRAAFATLQSTRRLRLPCSQYLRRQFTRGEHVAILVRNQGASTLMIRVKHVAILVRTRLRQSTYWTIEGRRSPRPTGAPPRVSPRVRSPFTCASHARRTAGIRMAPLPTERLVWHCGDHTAEPESADSLLPKLCCVRWHAGGVPGPRYLQITIQIIRLH